MSTWLYQISPKNWDPNRYRVDIWENQQWTWPVGKILPSSENPVPGDIVVFFYAPSGGEDPGFYGWAIIVEWYRGNGNKDIYFRPVSPSDHLKMHPWWDKTSQELANKIRGA